jgi:ADP-ribose pyrophosphatase
MSQSWKKQSRKKIYSSKNLTLYEDKVKLPDGAVIDYTVVKKNSIVIIIALNNLNQIATIKEYKYAIDKHVNTFPAGGIRNGEDVIDNAKRELLEETGCQSTEWVLLGELVEYPSKDMHRVFVALAKNTIPVKKTHLEQTELISQVQWKSVKQLKNEIAVGNWVTTSMISAFFLFLLKSKTPVI